MWPAVRLFGLFWGASVRGMLEARRIVLKKVLFGNPNAVLANRIIRCIYAVLANKIIGFIYLECSCVYESFCKGF